MQTLLYDIGKILAQFRVQSTDGVEMNMRFALRQCQQIFYQRGWQCIGMGKLNFQSGRKTCNDCINTIETGAGHQTNKKPTVGSGRIRRGCRHAGLTFRQLQTTFHAVHFGDGRCNGGLE